MNRGVLAACALALVSGAASAAPATPIKGWRCTDFLSLAEQYRPKVIYWASGFAKAGKKHDGTLDVVGIEKVTPAIVEECIKSPEQPFWDRLEKEWRRIKMEL